MSTSKNPLNRRTQFFVNITRICYYTGLPYINIEKDTPKISKIVYLYQTVTNVVIFVFIIMELITFFTGQKLTQKQELDRMLFGFSHPIIFFCYVLNVFHNKDEIKSLFCNSVVVLNEIYNDEKVEKEMIKKIKFYTTAYSGFFLPAVISYGLDALTQVIRNDATFTTVFIFWPDMEDRSTAANGARILYYVILCLFMMRMCGVYVLVITATVCLSHQYKNLQSYFYSLDNIFNENLSQIQKEQKCVKQCQKSFVLTFSGEVMLSIHVLVTLMSQMVNSDRTLMKLFSIVITGSALLLGTGLFMLNAGQITIQAAELPTAVYSSGWQNCHVSSAQIKHLVVSTIRQGHQPEVLWALGVVPLSYESYIKIVKSSYSVFSVLF